MPLALLLAQPPFANWAINFAESISYKTRSDALIDNH